jgi:hypothetical protein
MGIIKNYHDKKWTLKFLDALYNSIDIKRKLYISSMNYEENYIFLLRIFYDEFFIFKIFYKFILSLLSKLLK